MSVFFFLHCPLLLRCSMWSKQGQFSLVGSICWYSCPETKQILRLFIFSPLCYVTLPTTFIVLWTHWSRGKVAQYSGLLEVRKFGKMEKALSLELPTPTPTPTFFWSHPKDPDLEPFLQYHAFRFLHHIHKKFFELCKIMTCPLNISFF